MRILLTTLGSDGDLVPFYALAKGLIARGHDVRLATVGRYEARAKELGIPFIRVSETWNDAEMEAKFARVFQVKNPAKHFSLVIDTLQPELVRMVPFFKRILPSYDLLVSHHINLGAIAAAKSLGTPFVPVYLTNLKTSRLVNPFGSSFGPMVNVWMWRFASWVLGRAADPQLNLVLKEAGLAPGRNLAFKGSDSDRLELFAASSQVIPADPLWPKSYLQTGYWTLEEPEYKPPPALEELVGKEPPVVISFGSMSGIDAEKTTKTLLDAARNLGKPVVLQSGWAGLGAGALPKNVHRAEFVPHSWLLPRAACLVHHGGAGTTSAALRAGIPQLVVWHMGDQPAWGERVRRLGVGPRGTSHESLKSKWLVEKLQTMLTDQGMQDRARILGEKLRAERGVDRAVDAIEALNIPTSRPV
jgi:sterol 3beta-glucosyltransferase